MLVGLREESSSKFMFFGGHGGILSFSREELKTIRRRPYKVVLLRRENARARGSAASIHERKLTKNFVQLVCPTSAAFNTGGRSK